MTADANTPNLTPEGQRLADALVKARIVYWSGGRPLLSLDYGADHTAPINTAAALLLTAPEGEGAGLREALARQNDPTAFSPALIGYGGLWEMRREEAYKFADGLLEPILAVLPNAALTKQPAAQEPAAAGVEDPMDRVARLKATIERMRVALQESGKAQIYADGAVAAAEVAESVRLHCDWGPDATPDHGLSMGGVAVSSAVRRFADKMASAANLTPAAPKTPDVATGGSVGDGGLEPGLEPGEAAYRREHCNWEAWDHKSDAEKRRWIVREAALAQPAPVSEDETGTVDPALYWMKKWGNLMVAYDALAAPQPPKAETPAGVGDAKHHAARSAEIRAEIQALKDGGVPDDEHTQRATLQVKPTLSLYDAMHIAKAGFEAWAAMPHNKKWARKIVGTPIPNDLPISIARSFVQAAALSTAPAARPGDEVGIPQEIRDLHQAIADARTAYHEADGSWYALAAAHTRFDNACRTWFVDRLAAAPAADGGRA